MSSRRRLNGPVSALAVIVALGAAAPSWSDTLQEAIALAYQTNPTLQAQRASQRALDENYVQARAGLRPDLSVSSGASYSRTDSQGGTTVIDTDGDGIPDTTVTTGGVTENSSASASISLSQTLYSGGRISHGISATEAQIRQGRENLRAVEQQVLLSVIQAYVDVQRDLEILAIRENSVSVLRRQLDETGARFEVGEITRTDVAQSEARLAQAESDLAAARAQLSVSRAAYAAVVGQSPADLAEVPALPGVPDDFDLALELGLRSAPALLAAEYGLSAAEYRLAQARAEFRPSARLTASYGGTGDLSSFDLAQRQSFQATASVSVPLFTGGLNQSRVAQALEQSNAAQINVEGARRNVLREVSQAYAQIISARSTLRATEQAARAATIASEGVRQEAQVGLRTTLDVLNQELELRNAEVAYANARRNEYVAQAALLAAMGRLDAATLVQGIDVYDPEDNFRRVRNRGAVPWEGVVEAIDRVASPAVNTTPPQSSAPIDQQLRPEVVQTRR
ncbi:MAG: TolC family outer membrane protein [Brevundimonas sp.]|uniref:TolC family outer membrane protein n=1 Tax=Brevundimonas sp. TaxID=1871086 RepID=UPI00391A0741